MEIQNETVMKKGEEILSKMGQQRVSLFSKDYWYGSIMEWSMKNEQFKTQMFRFVDVLPSLETSEAVAKHLKEYFSSGGEELPKVFNVGLGLGKLAPGLMASTIRSNVTQMAKMFIVGETATDAIKVLKANRKNQLAFTVDILGEATLSEKEASLYQTQYLELMDTLSQETSHWDSHPILDQDHLGPIPKTNVSVKLTALYSQINECAWEETKKTLKDRLRPLLQTAKEKNIFLNLDMEHYGVKDLTLEVFKELIMEEDLISYRHFGCVIQAYLKDSYQDTQKLIDISIKRKTPFTIRLVKGAYWDTETIEAQQKTWPIPVFSEKAETDANYEDCSHLLLSNFPHIQVAFASHNVRSLAYAIETAKALKIPLQALEVQMLYGMAEPVKKTITQMGIRVREYCPMGELIPGMSYLVRRLLENTSNESWLRGKFAENKSLVELLGDPRHKIKMDLKKIRENNSLNYRKDSFFYNEPLLDFAISQHRDGVIQAIEKESAPGALFYKVPLVINNKTQFKSHTFIRPNPNDPLQSVAEVSLAQKEEADQAIAIAKQSFIHWKNKTADERAQLLNNLADLIQKNRYQIIATQSLEVGKTWTEADADVAEAIDFCRYYAREIKTVSKPKAMSSHIPGEDSLYLYEPRGVCLVISPWNFPLAILTGQVVAALVTGNTVIMKPAEQSSRTAYWLIHLLMEAGAPEGIVHFLPGIGEDVGAYMCEHPDIKTISFTGSKNVGLQIINQATQLKPNQKHIKKCIVEMGGKNAVIIDNDADLDEAVGHIVYSAFGFSGQKCSACSRVIVLPEVYNRFLDRLVEATRSLQVNKATLPRSFTGPVVDEESQNRILSLIEANKSLYNWKLTLPTPEKGYFVGPTIFADVDPKSALAQEEIFGPVLAVIPAKNIEEAVIIANDTSYALTGGVFSRSPEVIEYVKRNFECGNLYVNRGITGALVERHPFGGFKLSGLGSKAGGPDYLYEYMEARVVTENTMRRGFAPEKKQEL